MYYVYIIKSIELGILYRGCTSNLRSRMASHNKGKVKSTKKGKPWRLIYYEAFASKKDAIREEIFLKSGKGRERIKLLLPDSLK